MNKENTIYHLMPLVMRSIGAIAKEKENTTQKYFFRSVDDVLNHVQPALVEHSVSVSINVEDHKVTRIDTDPEKGKFQITASLRLRLSFFAPDGSSIESSAVGEAMDYSGDKATAKAMSMAFKYACFLGLVIPVEGMLEEGDLASAGEPEKTITPEESAVLEKLMKESGTDAAIVLEWAGVHSLSDMSKATYDKAIKRFEKKQNSQQPQPTPKKLKTTEIA